MYSGRFATVNGVGNVVTWSVTEAVEEDKIVNSATRGGTDRIFGDKDVTGSFTCHGGIPTVLPGETFTFVGYTSPTTGVYGTAGFRYTVSAICTGITVVWDFTTNKTVRYTMQFGGMGSLVVASGAGVLDATAVIKVPSRSCPMVYDTAVSLFTTLPGVTTVTLNMTNAVTIRSDAGTAGIKVREAGPLDWNLACVTNGHLQYMTPGTYLANLKLAVNATPDSFWFSDAVVGQVTDVTLTADGTAIDAQTVNIHMAASNAAGAVGFIRRPGQLLLNFWPVAA